MGKVVDYFLNGHFYWLGPARGDMTPYINDVIDTLIMAVESDVVWEICESVWW